MDPLDRDFEQLGSGDDKPLRGSKTQSFMASFCGEADDGDNAAVKHDLEGNLLGNDSKEAVSKSSILSSAINLSNTILGAGVLAMPYACAQVGIVLFGIMLIVVATFAHIAIRLLVLCVVKSDSPELAENAKYPNLGNVAYGRRGEIAAAAAVLLQQLGPCVMYIQISADVLVPILCQAGGSGTLEPFGSSPFSGCLWCNRSFWQIIAVVFIIFPICTIRRMDSLKYISAVAICFIMAFGVAVLIRGFWVLADPSLRWVNYEAIEPLWNTTSSMDCQDNYATGCYDIVPPGGNDDPLGDTIYLLRGKNILSALPILCFAFLCHQNMFPVYEDLHEASHQRMTSVSLLSMGTCISMYFGVGVMGYLTFLESNEPTRKSGVSGNVLTLYSAATTGHDFSLVMDILRAGYGINLVLSYPVMLFELRHVIEKYTVGEDAEYSFKRHMLQNTIVIGICTIIAIKVESVGTMFGLIGSTTSPAIVFILPSIFYLKLRKDGKARKLAMALGVFGALLVPFSLWSWATSL